MYNSKRNLVKKKDLEKQLRKAGWRFARHGGSHDLWTNGDLFEPMPRHTEINEILARKILKKAKGNPPKEK